MTICRANITEIKLDTGVSIFPDNPVTLEMLNTGGGCLDFGAKRFRAKDIAIPIESAGATLIFSDETRVNIKFMHYPGTTWWLTPKKVECKKCHKVGASFYYGEYNNNPGWMNWGQGYSCPDCSIPDL